MEVKYAVHPEDVKTYGTDRLRTHFHSADIMESSKIKLVYTHYDRFIYGGIVPVWQPLELPTYAELKSEYFLERRELGIINVGGKGTVAVDGEVFALDPLEALYVGKGKKVLVFESTDSANPARFYINSTPAHREYPTTLVSQADANQVELGGHTTSNKRTIYQYIHEHGVQSCQLVMGFTELHSGNVWNTFPPHTHDRRMEVYFYFDLPEDHIVMHFMGQPQETRHLVVKNEEAVVSPPWSIHSGAGTHNYKFIWGMGGENKAFSDMDGVKRTEVR